jgi:IS30 family transposase
MLAKVAGKDTRTVVTALIKQAKKLPKELYKSLTWDRGKELTAHHRFTLATNMTSIFATRKVHGNVDQTRTSMAC